MRPRLGPGISSAASLHFALATTDRRVVDAFYAAAVMAEGRDNGAPGVRERYYPGYYAAFVVDPYGNNIEGVCQVPNQDRASR
jgi:hypothetical protein